ncbi:MAG: NAD(P)-binding domain-containing protein, partial [Pseudomonadota bacterium]
RGLGDNDTGGLPEDIQAEIRAAVLKAINAWYDGEPVAIPEPAPELLVKMLSVAAGETVPDEYGEFTQAQINQKLETPPPIEVPDGFNVLIVGAGVSGICSAVNLQQAGVPFTIVEKHNQVGGVWYENRYPGAGVDTPNHLYSFSFIPYDWPMYFALQNDLHAYLEHVAKQFDLHRQIQFQTTIESAVWNESDQHWDATLRLPDGTTKVHHANVLISATGIFNPAVWPDIEGIKDFDGLSFHSTQWPADLDLSDKRVAIIGNGASAMQICPEIQDKVGSLTIFQRSTHWAAPFEKFRQPVPDPLRFLLSEMPIYRAWYRARLGWTFNDRVHQALQKDPDWAHPKRSLNMINDGHRQYFTEYVKKELGERVDLLDKVLPDYPPYGKRMLMDNGWYRMLRHEHVDLVDTHIERIEGNTVITADIPLGPRRKVLAALRQRKAAISSPGRMTSSHV